MKENLNFQIKFLEELLAKYPNFIPALIALGNIYTKNGEYEKGLAIDLKLSRICSDNPTIFYNLACSYSLLNKKTLGLKALEQAFKLGYDDINYLFRDPDLHNLRKSKRFSSVVEKYIKKNLSSPI
jgi:tetratricopeptide (TPR) repeat protein